MIYKTTISFLSPIVWVALLLTGCASHRSVSETESRDSVRVEYRERIIKVPDTVFVDIPAQTAERTTADSVSHLENDYALSDARINADGTLFHSLNTKPQQRPVITEKEIQVRDSIIYRDRFKTKTETKTVEVEKELSWFQKTQIYGFWAFFLFFAYSYRKKIFQAAVRVFLKK